MLRNSFPTKMNVYLLTEMASTHQGTVTLHHPSSGHLHRDLQHLVQKYVSAPNASNHDSLPMLPHTNTGSSSSLPLFLTQQHLSTTTPSTQLKFQPQPQIQALSPSKPLKMFLPLLNMSSPLSKRSTPPSYQPWSTSPRPPEESSPRCKQISTTGSQGPHCHQHSGSCSSCSPESSLQTLGTEFSQTATLRPG